MRYLILSALQFREARLLIVRRHLKDVLASSYQTALQLLRDFVPRAWWYELKKESSIVFRTGSILHFDGLDNAERAEKLLSTEWFRIFANEVTQLLYPQLWLLATRLSQQPVHVDTGIVGVRKIVADCNPREPQHWVHKLWYEKIYPNTEPPQRLRNHDTFYCLNWSVYDNLDNLPRDLITSLDAMPAIIRRRMRDGQWCASDKMVYDEFVETIHVISPIAIPRYWRRFAAIDFGFTNPMAVLLFATDETDHVYLYDEIYVRGKTTAQIVPQLSKANEKNPFEYIVCDWDAEDMQTLRDAGFSVRAADKRIQYGIDLVKTRLQLRHDGQPGLFICSNCMNTIKEIYGYHRPDDISSAKADIPVKENDHAMDALRYFIASIDGSGMTLDAELMARDSEKSGDGLYSMTDS